MLVLPQGIFSEEDGKLIEKEERNTGVISWKVVDFYLKAMRYPQACLVLIVTLIQYSLMTARDFWLYKDRTLDPMWCRQGANQGSQEATLHQRGRHAPPAALTQSKSGPLKNQRVE